MYGFIFSLIAITHGTADWVLDYDLSESECKQAVVHFEQAENLFVTGVTFVCEVQP